MDLIATLRDLRARRASLPDPLGLVPTMGYLHEGHLSLVRRAKAECASVAVSIFVNPTQFGPGEDLERYPRDLASDLRRLEPLGVDLVWNPPPEEVYPPRFQTYVTVEQAARPLEGRARPGHFRGVATVVAKLFTACLPQRAYFGQKDAQQLVVVSQMTRDLNFPIEIVVCPTVRESDGLAMSSRNAYLDREERKAATVLHRALTAARRAYERGERDPAVLRALLSRTLAAEPRAAEEYVSVADPTTLEELVEMDRDALLSMAVRVGKTRLIDNFLLRDGQWSAGIVAG